jgi:hypothetical protein
MEVRLIGAEVFHADRQMDGHGEANCRLCHFANAPKIEYLAGNTPHSHQLHDVMVLYLTVTPATHYDIRNITKTFNEINFSLVLFCLWCTSPTRA